MRRVVLVLATIALAILLAGGVAQAIINGEPDRGTNAHPYVAKVEGGTRMWLGKMKRGSNTYCPPPH
jgi:hypothetical protein